MVGSGTGSGKFDRIREKGLDPTGSESATLEVRTKVGRAKIKILFENINIMLFLISRDWLKYLYLLDPQYNVCVSEPPTPAPFPTFPSSKSHEKNTLNRIGFCYEPTFQTWMLSKQTYLLENKPWHEFTPSPSHTYTHTHKHTCTLCVYNNSSAGHPHVYITIH